jgi:hypothetical protein
VSRRCGDVNKELGVNMKVYRAMVWSDGPDQPGRRVSVMAVSLDHARQQLEAEYGQGSVFDLHNDDDAARPR